MATQIQLRHDTAANWTSADPTLASGEVGVETDTHKLKIGDGSTAWTSLSYGGSFNGDVSQTFSLSGDIAPDITASQNDWEPTGLSTASVIRVSSDAAYNITGLAGGADGRVLIVYNRGAFAITFKHQNASSTAANRFDLPFNDVVMAEDEAVVFWYSAASSRWRPIGWTVKTLEDNDVTTAKIANDAVTLAKIVNVSAASKLLGRGDSGAGDPQEITLGTGLSMTGTTLSSSTGGSGGIPDDNSVTTAKIVDANVTFAKIQDVSAASKLLGRGDSGSGDVEEVSLGAGLTMTGTTLAASGGLTGSIAFSGDISPTSLSANQNDYNPTGLSGASTIRQDASANVNITGLQGGADGRVILLHNISSANTITLISESASSTAGNRFTLPATSLTLDPKEAAVLQYDATSSRWRLLASTDVPTTAHDDLTNLTGDGGHTDLQLRSEKGAVSGYASLDGGGTVPDSQIPETIARVADLQDLAQSFALSGDITPPQITANQNNYSPSSLSTATMLRLSTDASRDVTGLVGGTDGRVIGILNVGAQPIVLKDESASSTAGNRFALNADITLSPDHSVMLWYDSTSSRWRCLARYT